MDNNMLAAYMADSIGRIVKKALRSSFKNPKEALFLLRFGKVCRKALEKRLKFEKDSRHIPPFLIASISRKCNLYCKGCYARANHSCDENNNNEILSEKRWGELFKEAESLGISFILLAGGEPLIQIEIIKKAAAVKNIMFPIFTNGTLIDDEYIRCFKKNRNLLPILSIEGDKEATDKRRGKGTYDKLAAAMDNMKKAGILFGASVTVTTENIEACSDLGFIDYLHSKGTRVLFYVEYVPVDNATENLAPSENERKHLEEKLKTLRSTYKDIIFLSFPGDEEFMGGCLAAGRGFFHINAGGGAEPCPFSPYSDYNLKEHSILEALDSPLFKKLASAEFLKEQHSGGCLLFSMEEKVKELL